MPAQEQDKQRNAPRTKVGVVVSDHRDKTRAVIVKYQTRHPKYGKYLLRQAKYHVHDENNASKSGDRVEIASCRPLSKNKAWRLTQVIEQAPEGVVHQQEYVVDDNQ